MGLNIAYQLTLPPATDRATVEDRVRQLRERALRLPFQLVCDMMSTTAGHTLGSVGGAPVTVEFWFRSWASLTLSSDDEDGSGSDVLPDSVGFIVLPGQECEPAAFGMAWAPPRDANWTPLPDQPMSWCWQSVCKTQYASIVSLEHFVRCHTSIVALLDAAVELGFGVTVHDEGGYWESRDADELLAHVDQMNHLVAGMAGTLHDAIGEEHSVDAPIFGHPDFERLETRAQSPPP